MRSIARAFLAVSFCLTLFAATPVIATPDGSPGQSGEDHGKSGEDHGNGNGNDNGNGNGNGNGSGGEVCDAGGADAAAIAAVRADAASQCDCSGSTNHGRYVSCIMRVANAAVRNGDLPSACRENVVNCAVRSA